MNTFPLKISSPQGDLFCGDAVKISLRGTEGDFAVMAGHIPFVTSVRPCDCRIELPDETLRTGRTGGGLLTVMKNQVIFLSGDFVWNEEA